MGCLWRRGRVRDGRGVPGSFARSDLLRRNGPELHEGLDGSRRGVSGRQRGSTCWPNFLYPAENIRQRATRDRVPYDQWTKDGFLVATPGNVVDYEAVRAELQRWAAEFDVREIAFDPWNDNPHPLDKAVTGAVVAGLAVVVNLIAARWILRAATEHQSIALEASADHLIADVITSLGVIVGIILIWLTDWNRLDPIIAILVAINILRVGLDLTRRSMLGLLDTALPANELEQINRVLALLQQREHVEAHALRTRRAGQRRFGSVHILVPGNWTVDRGHRLVEQIEHEIRAVVPGIAIVTHLESLDDPRSWEDESLPGPRDTM